MSTLRNGVSLVPNVSGLVSHLSALVPNFSGKTEDFALWRASVNCAVNVFCIHSCEGFVPSLWSLIFKTLPRSLRPLVKDCNGNYRLALSLLDAHFKYITPIEHCVADYEDIVCDLSSVLIDSLSSMHVLNHKAWFTDLRDCAPGVVKTDSGVFGFAQSGPAVVPHVIDGKIVSVSLTTAVYSPDAPTSLLSATRFWDRGVKTNRHRQFRDWKLSGRLVLRSLLESSIVPVVAFAQPAALSAFAEDTTDSATEDFASAVPLADSSALAFDAAVVSSESLHADCSDSAYAEASTMPSDGSLAALALPFDSAVACTDADASLPSGACTVAVPVVVGLSGLVDCLDLVSDSPDLVQSDVGYGGVASVNIASDASVDLAPTLDVVTSSSSPSPSPSTSTSSSIDSTSTSSASSTDPDSLADVSTSLSDSVACIEDLLPVDVVESPVMKDLGVPDLVVTNLTLARPVFFDSQSKISLRFGLGPTLARAYTKPDAFAIAISKLDVLLTLGGCGACAAG